MCLWFNCGLLAVVLKLQCTPGLPRGLQETQTAGSQPEFLDQAGTRGAVTNQFSDATEAAGWGPHFDNCYLRRRQVRRRKGIGSGLSEERTGHVSCVSPGPAPGLSEQSSVSMATGRHLFHPFMQWKRVQSWAVACQGHAVTQQPSWNSAQALASWVMASLDPAGPPSGWETTEALPIPFPCPLEWEGH